MAKFTNLRVWHQSRELLRLVSAATADMRAEGDLKSQMRRAAISVASNIASLRPVVSSRVVFRCVCGLRLCRPWRDDQRSSRAAARRGPA